MTNTLTPTLMLAGFLALLGTPAFAHAHLSSAEPGDGALVTTATAQISLKFTEALSVAFSGITLSSSAGLVPQQPAALDPADDTRLVIPLIDPLPPGKYTLDWRVLSTDGHKTTGSYRFTVK